MSKRTRRDRMLAAAERQHDMVVEFYMARLRGDRFACTYAPVSEFLAGGETFCSGNHAINEECSDADT